MGPGLHPKDVGALADAYIPANFVEPSTLLQFLKDSAKPPVAIGFGSMPFGQAQAVIQGLEALQCPAVLVGQALANFEATELPKCRCMVCHGGAGTLHSSLRAGVPAIIAPLIGDQFAFAKLIDARELGDLAVVECLMGINAGPLSALTADALVESLKKLDEPLGARCVANAREFAAKIKVGGP
eukprot:Skav206584  [mRNA]  locus=scaffold925:950784:952393:- [translate_table: standard]